MSSIKLPPDGYSIKVRSGLVEEGDMLFSHATTGRIWIDAPMWSIGKPAQ